MTIKKARQLAKKNVSEKRYEHTLNVKKMAIKLAKLYGADEERVAIAALLHDVFKEKTRAELLLILQENAIIADNAQNRPTPVWHGVCAAIVARTQWDIKDEEILSAIACHTTGKANMSLIDKIIYLSDMLCKERDFEGIEVLRDLAYKDINLAMRACLKCSMDFVLADGKPLDPATLEAYKDYK